MTWFPAWIKKPKKISYDLKSIVPEARFITEEGAIDNDQKEFTWIVDPLNGKTNFIHGSYILSVFDFYKGTDTVRGIVYELNKNELFYA